MIGIVIVLIMLRVIIVVLILYVYVLELSEMGKFPKKRGGVFLEQGGGGGPNHSTNYGTSITIC